MQVDHFKPVLKAAGTMCVKLKYGRLLSSGAFKSDLRQYDVDDPDVLMELLEVLEPTDTTAPGGVYSHLPKPAITAGRDAGGDEAEADEVTALMAGLGVSGRGIECCPPRFRHEI